MTNSTQIPSQIVREEEIDSYSDFAGGGQHGTTLTQSMLLAQTP